MLPLVLIDLKMCAYANGQLRGSPLTRRRDTLQEVGVAWVVGVVVRLRTALGVGVEFYRRKRREKVRNRAAGKGGENCGRGYADVIGEGGGQGAEAPRPCVTHSRL